MSSPSTLLLTEYTAFSIHSFVFAVDLGYLTRYSIRVPVYVRGVSRCRKFYEEVNAEP